MSRILELFHDLSDEIAATETVDLHSHLNWPHPQARSLGHMVFYHFISNELHAAGMPEAQLLLKDPVQRLEAALPWLAKIANTGTAYCLRRILRDLYGMKEDNLDAQNLHRVIGQVEETAADAEWPREVIRRRARLACVFVSVWPGRRRRRDAVAGVVDATSPDKAREEAEAARYDDIFRMAVEHGFAFEDDFVWLSNPDSPHRQKGFAPDSAREWIDKIWSCLDGVDLSRVKAYLSWMSVRFRHEPGDAQSREAAAEEVWQRGLAGHPVGADGAMTLRMFAFDSMVQRARAAGVPVQVFFGSIHQGGTEGAWDATHADYSPETIREFGRMANANRDVRFEFLEGVVNNSQEMAIMMKMRQNVGAAGAWWHSMYPSYIRRILSERLDTAPMTKTSLFFSDAYMTEWCYGKRKLVEREFAYVLGERVAFGYMSRADASRVIHAWMRENPARTYDIPELLD